MVGADQLVWLVWGGVAAAREARRGRHAGCALRRTGPAPPGPYPPHYIPTTQPPHQPIQTTSNQPQPCPACSHAGTWPHAHLSRSWQLGLNMHACGPHAPCPRGSCHPGRDFGPPSQPPDTQGGHTPGHVQGGLAAPPAHPNNHVHPHTSAHARPSDALHGAPHGGQLTSTHGHSRPCMAARGSSACMRACMHACAPPMQPPCSPPRPRIRPALPTAPACMQGGPVRGALVGRARVARVARGLLRVPRVLCLCHLPHVSAGGGETERD